MLGAGGKSGPCRVVPGAVGAKDAREENHRGTRWKRGARWGGHSTAAPCMQQFGGGRLGALRTLLRCFHSSAHSLSVSR